MLCGISSEPPFIFNKQDLIFQNKRKFRSFEPDSFSEYFFTREIYFSKKLITQVANILGNQPFMRAIILSAWQSPQNYIPCLSDCHYQLYPSPVPSRQPVIQSKLITYYYSRRP